MPRRPDVKREDRIVGNYPDAAGHFGPGGGSFVAGTLVGRIEKLADRREHVPVELGGFVRGLREALDNHG